ncbi:MAG: response regulator transcription factor [Deltaproteobacteria bacterium]|nr:response regulator transcription factor [Deltaproteobacteria bacterium]
MQRGITVAVIDSNSGAREGLIRRLQQIPGITVLGEAADPEEAIRVVSEQRPDVVLVDVRGIDRDGAEFLSQMAAAVPKAKIVVLTAYVTEQERSVLMRAGAQAILLKEIGSDRLVQTMRTVAAQPAGGGD